MFETNQIVNGRYRILREIGQGGFGRVFLAEELERLPVDGASEESSLFDGRPRQVLRQVALKTFISRPKTHKALLSELRALCRLSHPNIIAVHDYQIAEPSFIVMEYVVGRDLQSWLDDRGPMGLAKGLAVAQQVGQALSHAHSFGLVHRDIKPSNVMVTEEGGAKLVDFGLARNTAPLTRSSTQLGTPGFVAPELLDPERFKYPVGIPADVYGFGCLVFALLTGVGPFPGATPVQILRHQLTGKRSSFDALHPLVRAIVERATALQPSERFPSIGAVLEQLRRVRGGLETEGRVQHTPRRVDLIDAQLIHQEVFRHPHRGRGVKFELGLPGSDEVFRGFVYEESSSKGAVELFDTMATAWPGAEISLFDGLEIHSPEKGTFVTADDATVSILEPHFLVSVTDVVRSLGVRGRSCAGRPFVDRRRSNRTSEPLLYGRIVHMIFDRLLDQTGGSHSFDSDFHAVFSRNRIDAVAAGLRDKDIEVLKRKAHVSYQWLVRYLSKRTATVGKSVEVTRHSGHYGIEGRIDAALLSSQKLDILELKSGRHQAFEHESQVRCYALLWDGFADSVGRQIKGQLLYSQVGHEKEVVRSDHKQERRILHSRNAIVAAHHAYARGDAATAVPYYDQWPERCVDPACRWRQGACERQTTALGFGRNNGPGTAASPNLFSQLPTETATALVEYHRHFTRLTHTEYVAQTRLHGEFTRPDFISERIEELSAIGDATLVEWDEGLGAVRFSCTGAERFVPGTQVVCHFGQPNSDPTLVGRIERVTDSGLIVQAEGASISSELSKQGWIIERLTARIGLTEATQALWRLLETRDSAWLETLLLRSTENGPNPTPPGGSEADDEGLNDAQQTAIEMALSDGGRPLLIHGPPGTGKTTVIGRLVAELVAAGNRVLVTAGTNTAVDNILLHLLARGVDFLRLGHLERYSRLAAEASNEVLSSRIEQELNRREDSLDRIADRLKTVPVIAGTAHRCIRSATIDAILGFEEAAKSGGAPSRPFDVAIVDEATQLTEPLTIGAVLLAKRFVLVGDSRQLPPVITAPEACCAHVDPDLSELAKEMGLRGLDWTLFERLAGHVPEAALTIQYRMNGQVQEIANRLYYDGKLESASSVERRQLQVDISNVPDVSPAIRARLDPKQPIVWETLVSEPNARRNDAEIEQVVATVDALVKSHLDGDGFATDIGVITPFRVQTHAIRKALRNRLGAEVADRVEVDTVERFQGREKEVIIVSLVVSTWSDFVMDRRRLNVAFTRARSKLIVFGPAQLLYRFEQSGLRLETP